MMNFAGDYLNQPTTIFYLSSKLANLCFVFRWVYYIESQEIKIFKHHDHYVEFIDNDDQKYIYDFKHNQLMASFHIRKSQASLVKLANDYNLGFKDVQFQLIYPN